jgi:hypothetical protein
MNVKKIHEMIEILKNDLGDALMATDIWSTADGRSIAAHNAQPKAVALFNRITKYLVNALNDSDFPTLDEYYTINLKDKKFVVVLLLGDFQQGMLVDTSKVETGLLLNVTVPKLFATFRAALEE